MEALQAAFFNSCRLLTLAVKLSTLNIYCILEYIAQYKLRCMSEWMYLGWPPSDTNFNHPTHWIPLLRYDFSVNTEVWGRQTITVSAAF